MEVISGGSKVGRRQFGAEVIGADDEAQMFQPMTIGLNSPSGWVLSVAGRYCLCEGRADNVIAAVMRTTQAASLAETGTG